MAEIAGKAGSITFATYATGVKSWTLNWAGDLEEITDFADGAVGYKKYLATLTDWTATTEFNWEAANTSTPGTAGTLTLTVTSGTTYSGAAILQTLDINETVGGVVSGSATFQGNGLLTLA
jgi:hypothetical protein